MSLDIPVFNTKGLRKAFYIFLGFNIVITVGSIVLKSTLDRVINHSLLGGINLWILLLVLLAGSFLFSFLSKRELTSILAIDNHEQQFTEYENYYKKKLIWNAVSVVLSAAFYLFTSKNYFLYLLLLQVVLSFSFYPSKTLLSRELKKDNIEFT